MWRERVCQIPWITKTHKMIKHERLVNPNLYNKNVKLLHNLYRKNQLFVAKDGLIQIKHTDNVHNVEYNAISVPQVYLAPLANSVHLKLNHPSSFQLGKIMSRQFYCPGMAAVLNKIAEECNTCVRLKKLPKEIREYSTTDWVRD